MAAAWFSDLITAQTAAFLLVSVCCNAHLDIPICSLSAPDGFDVPLASEDELRQHTFNWCPKRAASRKKIKRQFDWSPTCSSKFHGFILFNTNGETCPPAYSTMMTEAERDEWNSVFHHKLPELMRNRHYQRQFGNIFARVHGSHKARTGDGKRQQIKFSKILRIALTRLKSAKTPEKKQVAQAELDLMNLAKDLLAAQYKRLVQVSCSVFFSPSSRAWDIC